MYRHGWGARSLALRSYILYAEYLRTIGVMYFTSIALGELDLLHRAWDQYLAQEGAPTEAQVLP